MKLSIRPGIMMSTITSRARLAAKYKTRLSIMVAVISSIGAVKRFLGRTRRRVFLAALALMVPGLASASTITYVFSSDASLVIGGDTETIAGNFSFDPATTTESNVSITLTGAFLTSTFSEAGPLVTSSNDQIYAYVYGSGELFWSMTLDFADPLSTTNDPLSSADLDFLNTGTNEPDLPVTGSAVPSASAIPEPSTWALTLLGFAGVGFAAYRRRSPKNGSWLVRA